MPTTTTNLGLYKPTVGGDTDAWGGQLNDNFDDLDAIFKSDGTGTSVGLNVGTGKSLKVGGSFEASVSQNAKTQIKVNNANAGASASAGVVFGTSSGDNGYVGANGGAASSALGGANAVQITNLTAAPIVFATDTTERARITSTGQVAVAGAGSAAAPVLTKSDDLNTGIFFPAADQVGVSAGGTERLNVSSAGANLSGNLTFTGTGNRITGDFSNATIANRVMFQTSTTNENTTLSVIPNGTATGSGICAINNSDPTNSAAMGFSVSSTVANLASSIFGTGTYLPMTFTTGGSERMRIDTSGNVGIGTSSPSTKLHVFNGAITTQQFGAASLVDFYCAEGTSASPTALISGRQFGSLRGFGYDGSSYITAASIDMQAQGAWSVGDTPSFLRFRTTATGGSITERARITSAGEFWVAGTTDQGAYNIQCNGTGVWGAGAYVNGSDERIKEDIAPIESGLDVVEKLNPVTYRYKESWTKDQSTQTGFIAQELLVALEGKNYVDGVVQQGGSEGYYSVAYQNIIPILTKAIQELKAELDETKARLAALESA